MKPHFRPYRFALIPVTLLSILGLQPPPAPAYINHPPTSLGMLCYCSTHVAIVQVEKLDRQKGIIVFRKVRDIKGKWPTEQIKQSIGTAPGERQYIMQWAEVGKTTAMFALDGNANWSYTYIDKEWYGCKTGDWQWWKFGGAEPILFMAYSGKTDRLMQSVQDIMAGKEVVVTCMATLPGDNMQTLALKKAKVQRLRASLKLLNYNQKRDFVSWGSDDDAAAVVSSTSAVEPWATYRGNVERTGNTDNLAGPATPRILWAFKSKDHYVASPVPVGDRLFLSGLGAFNVANFACLATDPKFPAEKRTLWFKSTPFLKLPTVSSPSLVDGKIIFGDGMHQTDGATLYCMDVAKGLPIWQHPVPGTLVHLEGSPTIQDGRAYIGGGAAGVICVDVSKVTLEGKPLDLAAVQKILDLRWKELQAKYEVDKKKDPDFAIPPSEDQLPRANPNRLWQQGKDKWHVDAPVTVVGDKVIVCSAYLDKEQVGDRALVCLDAKTGAVVWRTPLRINPWGGASISGKQVIVTGSSIGYYPNSLKGAKGLVASYNLADGKEQWSKDVAGGVVACAALADGAAVVTATDGKVRAFNLQGGERRWIYDAKMPFFAPPAVAKNTVYAGDFKGAIHAIDLKAGLKQWVLDLGTAPETKSPGMVYGGPVVHAGRVYVATCNLEGPYAREATVVVCIGEK